MLVPGVQGHQGFWGQQRDDEFQGFLPEPRPGEGPGDLPPLPGQHLDRLAADMEKAWSPWNLLEWTGDTLGKLGRPIKAAVSGAVGGRWEPGELLSWVPFSDTLGLTDPRKQVRGSEIAQRLGVPGTYTPGTGADLGDWAGLGIDILFDPLSWGSFGAGGLVSSGAKAATRLGLRAKDAARAAVAAGRTATAATEGLEAAAGLARASRGPLERFGNWMRPARPLGGEALEQSLQGFVNAPRGGALTDLGRRLGQLGYLPERHASRMAGLSGGVGEDILSQAAAKASQMGRLADPGYFNDALAAVRAGETLPLQGVARLSLENVPFVGKYLPDLGVTLGARPGLGRLAAHAMFPGFAQAPWLADAMKYGRLGGSLLAPVRAGFMGKYMGQSDVAGQRLAEDTFRPLLDKYQQELRGYVNDAHRGIRNLLPGREGQALVESNLGQELLQRVFDWGEFDPSKMSQPLQEALRPFSSFDWQQARDIGHHLRGKFKDAAQRLRGVGGEVGFSPHTMPRHVMGKDLDYTQFARARTFDFPAFEVEKMVKDAYVSGPGRAATDEFAAAAHLLKNYPDAFADLKPAELLDKALSTQAALRDVAAHHRLPGSAYYAPSMDTFGHAADWLARRTALTESAAELLARQARHLPTDAALLPAEKAMGDFKGLGRYVEGDIGTVAHLSNMGQKQGADSIRGALARKLGLNPEQINLDDFQIPTAQTNRILTGLAKQFEPRLSGWGTRLYDWWNNLARAGLTIPFPGHWVGNLVGSLVHDSQRGVYDPARKWLGVLGPWMQARRALHGGEIRGLAERLGMGHASDLEATQWFLKKAQGGRLMDYLTGHAAERTGRMGQATHALDADTVKRLADEGRPIPFPSTRLPGDIGSIDPLSNPHQSLVESLLNPRVQRAPRPQSDVADTLEALATHHMVNTPAALTKAFFDRAGSLNPINVRGVGGRTASGLLPARLGEYVTQDTDATARLGHMLGRIYQGFSPEQAIRSAMEGHFDYRNLAPFERDYLRRLFMFYCVPVGGSEILTRNGWKSCDELAVGEDVLTYSVADDCLEWQPCLAKSVFDHDRELNRWSNSRSGDLTFTDGHRWVVYAGRKMVKGKWYGGRENRKVKESSEITTDDNILVAAPLRDGLPSIMTPEQARLVGWILTDGHHRWTGNCIEARIYQSPGKYLDEVKAVAGGTVYKPHPATGVVAVNVEIVRRKSVAKFLDKNKLPMVVTQLSREAAEAMFDAMMKAEGHESGGSDCFTQKDGPVMEAFVILATMLGKKLGKVAKYGEGMARVYVHKSRSLRAREMDRAREKYVGRVWCPATANGTWVMRQSGAVTITGNSFPRFNAEFYARQLASNPGTVTPWLKATNAISGDQERLPEYLRGRTVVRRGTVGYSDPDSGRTTDYARLTAIPAMPQEEALRGLYAGLSGQAVSRNVDWLGGQLSPVPRAAVERLIGRTFQGHHRLGMNRLEDPSYPDWVRYTPLARAYSTAYSLTDRPHRPPAEAADRLLSLLGFRTSLVDTAADRDQRLARLVQERLGEMGVANQGRVPDELRARVLVDPEAQALVRAAKTLGLRAQERKLERQVEQAADILRAGGPQNLDQAWTAYGLPGLRLRLEAARRSNDWLDRPHAYGAPNPLIRGLDLGRRLRMMDRNRVSSLQSGW